MVRYNVFVLDMLFAYMLKRFDIIPDIYRSIISREEERMKKFGNIMAILMLAAMPQAFAQDTSVNVNSYTIPELPALPEIDGDLTDSVWENVPTIPMDKDGDAPAAEPGTGDLDITLKVAWDEETNALFLSVNVIDESFVNVQGLGSTAGSSGWRNERLEVVIDGTNSGVADSSTTSGFHQQYTFDMPNNWDGFDPETGLFGGFDQEPDDYPVTVDFFSVPVYERIEGTLNLGEAHYPWDISDDYVQSAAMIRVTDPAATEWFEAPVEYNWEVKIVVFEFLTPASDLGYDIDNPDNIQNGWQDFWEDEFHDVLDMEEDKVIGFSAQQNDADVYAQEPEREHQTNTTGFDQNWNSSENLTGLILGPALTNVADWSIQ